jgi:hypothetical protein
VEDALGVVWVTVGLFSLPPEAMDGVAAEPLVEVGLPICWYRTRGSSQLVHLV